MLDDIREEATSSELEEEAYPTLESEIPIEDNRFLGMSPIQRFTITLIFLFMVCILSALFLLVTETIVLPF